MDTDGGGWITLARVGDTLKSRPITAQTYFDGVSPENKRRLSGRVYTPCANLNGIADKHGKTLTQFILRVSMGKVRDYFKPSKPDGTSLCHMLMHDNSHVWSPDADGMASSLSDAAAKAIAGIGWITPMYSQVGPQLGSSRGKQFELAPWHETDGLTSVCAVLKMPLVGAVTVDRACTRWELALHL